ncbi:diguanylate cyclase [uncultured Shewanella sp.]|uniref:sensor domain-containing diguanylate cyclase n=1 Tax=uncultured Shewanella sp. TaxID=173975 RepID=UPI002611DEB6|nr:diguanylate cyclase [uncultured Shewanella sp.]
MKLNHFLNLLGLVILLLSFLAASVIYQFVYLPAIESQIRSQQEKELLAVQRGIKFSQKSLETLCYDYAVWDEMVEFVDSGEQAFIDSNLSVNSFEAADIDGAYLFDTQGELLWQYYANPKLSSHLLQRNDAAWVGDVLPDDNVIDGKKPSTRNGIINLNGTVVYFSNAVVLPTRGSGEIVGSLLMIRAIDTSLLEQIRQLSLVNFNIESLDPGQSYSGLTNFDSSPDIGELASKHEWLINDIFGVPTLKITVVHDERLSPSIFTPESILLFITLIIATACSVIPVSVMILRPIRSASLVLDKMAERGVLYKMRTTWHIDEIVRLSSSFNLMVDKLERHQNYLESLSYKDPLTGIANRRSLEVFAQRAFTQWKEGKGVIGFLMIDIDLFKEYNDSLGHQAGDKAILSIAQTLLLECRRRGELVTRYGGEEFCVVIQGDNFAQMELLSKRMLEKVRELNIYHPKSSFGDRITVSIGGVFYEHFHPSFTEASWESMVALADEQLYKAKLSGRNQLKLEYRRAKPLQLVE